MAVRVTRVTSQSQETEQVRDYLARSDVHPQVARLVQVWNRHQLLGIDLADMLREMIEHTEAPFNCARIDWGELAEELALSICQVDEAELTRRRAQEIATNFRRQPQTR